MSTKNVHPAVAAIASIDKGTAMAAKGKVALTSAIVDDLERGVQLVATVGDERFPFALADYAMPIYRDGKEVAGIAKAKCQALCDYWGVEFTIALQSTILQAVKAAIGLRETEGAAIKGDKVILPLGLCGGINLGDADKPSATGKQIVERLNFGRKRKLSVGDALAKAKAEPVDCIGGAYTFGGKRPTMTQAMAILANKAVDAGKAPAKVKRNTTRGVDADSVGAAIALANRAFVMIERSDESPIAFTEKHDRQLRELAEHIAAYFAS